MADERQNTPQAVQTAEKPIADVQSAVAPAPKRKSMLGKAFRIVGMLVLVFVLGALIINSMLVMFKPDYYTTIGNYRLFAIVTDSMEPTIPTGSMIVCEKPTDTSVIKASTSGNKDGTVITFKVKATDGSTILLTHRVVSITTGANGEKQYITRGDNAGGNDSGTRKLSDIVGIYTGKKIGFLGSLLGFFQSSLGVSVLIFALFIVIIAWAVLRYLSAAERRKQLETAALKKSAEALSTISLRYDNIHEITAVMDVLGMVTSDGDADSKEIMSRLNAFVHAETFELPNTPETAAILDTLPAPDTPGALSIALSTGATLRQAEDGASLVLTTASGDKNILLTPVQTNDGVILCQQGARLRSDIAPNIEDIGITSMPASPEFFEGQPLEKSVIYPELPPSTRMFDTDMLPGGAGEKQQQPFTDEQNLLAAALSAPEPAVAVDRVAVTQLLDAPHNSEEQQQSAPNKAAPVASQPQQSSSAMSRLAYIRYREMSAQLELRQTEELHGLLDNTAPLTKEEQARVEQYKAANKKPAKPRTPRTEEQKQAAKQAAERKKLAHEAFMNALAPEDRELYLTEQKLQKTRAATIRKLKRMAADRKILNKLDEE